MQSELNDKMMFEQETRQVYLDHLEPFLDPSISIVFDPYKS